MTPAPAPSRPRNAWIDRLLIAAFLVLLWLPAVDMVFHVDHARQTGENRLPAAPPNTADLRAGNLQKFIADSEGWFTDHFGFRNLMIRWFQNWKLGLFHDRSVYRVMIGPNHWLFFSELRMVEHFLGMAKFTEADMAAWQKLLENRRDWLAKRGIKYLVVIPPDKQNIYPEELPTWLQQAMPKARETKLDQFVKFMREHSTMPVIDLRQTLLDGKKVRPTYLSTDTHWNTYGGFLACQQLVDAAAKLVPGVPPLRTEDFTFTNAYLENGDLGKMIGSAGPEANHFKMLPQPGVAMPALHDTPDLKSAWPPFRVGALSENPATNLTATAMVFHDSYGLFWRPVLGCCFKRVWYLQDNREFNTGVIGKCHPDIVINEILERYFNTLEVQDILRLEHLP